MSKETERLGWPEGELSGALNEALMIARKDDVSSAQVARLAATLAPLYGLSIASSAQAAASTQVAAASQAGGATAGTTSAGATSASIGASVSTAASLKVIAAVLATAALGTAGILSVGAPLAREQAAREQTQAASSPAPEVPSSHAPVEPSSSRAVVEPAPEASGATLASPVTPSTAEAGATRIKRPHANAPVEAQLLTEAHAALTGDAAQALRLADQHRARFPRGALAAERELLAVRALEQLDRQAEARTRIARAIRELPRSAPLQRAADRLGAPK